jgi:hypothetical protein
LTIGQYGGGGNRLVAVYPFLMRERWRVLSTKSEYPGSRVTERFPRHLELGLSIKGGVKIGGRPGSQTLLENRRMLARTNIYPWITHLFFASTHGPSISSSIYKHVAGIRPQGHPLGLDLVEPN